MPHRERNMHQPSRVHLNRRDSSDHGFLTHRRCCARRPPVVLPRIADGAGGATTKHARPRRPFAFYSETRARVQSPDAKQASLRPCSTTLGLGVTCL